MNRQSKRVAHSPERESKLCEVCGRLFTNRKRWNARGQWDEVRYCSKSCRSQARRIRRSDD